MSPPESLAEIQILPELRPRSTACRRPHGPVCPNNQESRSRWAEDRRSAEHRGGKAYQDSIVDYLAALSAANRVSRASCAACVEAWGTPPTASITSSR